MEVTSAWLRTGLRAFNRVGERLERAGVELVSLDEQRLLDAACRETGIPKYGDEGFREPLRLLLRALDNEGRLTLLGRIAARADIAGLLATRLRLEAEIDLRVHQTAGMHGQKPHDVAVSFRSL